jgi:hypothetical protein
MGKLAITEEEREARRQRALALVEQGRLGGSQYGKLGGRPKKKRASELVAEKAAEEADQIWARLRGLIFQADSDKIALDAIKHVHALEEQERKVDAEEEVRYEQLKRNELLTIVVGNLARLAESGQLDLAEVIGVEERAAIGPGEIDNGFVEETGS